jgi:hypothetical protein
VNLRIASSAFVDRPHPRAVVGHGATTYAVPAYSRAPGAGSRPARASGSQVAGAGDRVRGAFVETVTGNTLLLSAHVTRGRTRPWTWGARRANLTPLALDPTPCTNCGSLPS